MAYDSFPLVALSKPANFYSADPVAYGARQALQALQASTCKPRSTTPLGLRVVRTTGAGLHADRAVRLPPAPVSRRFCSALAANFSAL